MMGIGVWVYQRNKSLTDFVLGGRSLGSWVAALSAQASDMSGWLLLGLPGAAYVGGLGGRLDRGRARHRDVLQLAFDRLAAKNLY